MNYELAKELKDAGFPQNGRNGLYLYDLNDAHTIETGVYAPTLEELIEACGEDFCGLSAPTKIENFWRAFDRNLNEYGHGTTPTEAVARLWLALNAKLTDTK